MVFVFLLIFICLLYGMASEAYDHEFIFENVGRQSVV
jgi:Na+-transporting methylmalonyl-CoA/oxaloacetate decarboxylase gamma subunit